MRTHTSTLWTLLTASALGLGLTACNDKQPPAEPAVKAPATSPAPAAPSNAAEMEQKQAKARNEYNRAYNRLIDDNRSIAAMYKSYVGLGINGKKKIPSSFYGAPDDVERVMKDLKAARAVGSGDAQLDGAVDSLIAAGDKLATTWASMDSYFRTKAFLDDNWAKAKANDAAMTAGFTGVIASIDKLGSELDRLQDAQRVERMAKLKSQGDMVTYNVLNTMDYAKKFVTELDKLDSLKNKEAVAKVDERVKALEAALTDLSQSLRDEKQKSGKELDTGYTNLVGKMESMIGQWRTFKDSKSPMTYRNIIGYYNDAIGIYNRGLNRK